LPRVARVCLARVAVFQLSPTPGSRDQRRQLAKRNGIPTHGRRMEGADRRSFGISSRAAARQHPIVPVFTRHDFDDPVSFVDFTITFEGGVVHHKQRLAHRRPSDGASFWPSREDRNRDMHRCTAAGRADNLHVPAECFYSVDQADEPRSIAAVGSTDAVVANGERQIRPVD
jgi:hypothetical protein